MKKNFLNCAAGGCGVSMALHAAVSGMWLVSGCIAALALACLMAGWVGCQDAEDLRTLVEDADRASIESFNLASRTAADAATYLHTLLTARDLIRSCQTDAAFTEIADAVADFETDPEFALARCMDWLAAIQRQIADAKP